jgi:hypothetical protein
VRVRATRAEASVVGRAVSAVERAVLRLLLFASFDGVAELRAQVDRATVTGRCACGCPSVELAVPDDVPRSSCAGRLAPVEARAGDQTVILFLDDGRLSYLELVDVGVRPPGAWPPVEQMSITPAH